jgi:hypothetical protein
MSERCDCGHALGDHMEEFCAACKMEGRSCWMLAEFADDMRDTADAD